MKKFIALLLAVCMIFSFAACGKEKEEAKAAAETVSNPGIQFTERLPILGLAGTYEAFTAKAEAKKELLYSLKGQSGSEFLAFVGFTWQNEGITLLEYAKKDIEKYYKDQNISPVENDSFYQKGDYNYVYFTAFDTASFEEPSYVQVFYFQDGYFVYEAKFFRRVSEVTIEGSEITGYLPDTAKQAESYELKADGPFARYLFNSEFANLDVYIDDAKDITIDDVISEYQKSFKAEKLNSFEIEREGKEPLKCCSFDFCKTIDGIAKTNSSYVILADKKLVILNFWQEDANFSILAKASIPALFESFK